MAKHWQHTTPTDDHVATPPPAERKPTELPVGTRSRCGECKRTIYVTRPDEGPESMKAMFRF